MTNLRWYYETPWSEPKLQYQTSKMVIFPEVSPKWTDWMDVPVVENPKNKIVSDAIFPANEELGDEN